MAGYLLAARCCDATVTRGAAEPVDHRLRPGGLRELLSGPLRRRAPSPPAAPTVCSKAGRRRVLHGGVLPGGAGVLNEGVLVLRDTIADSASAPEDLRSMHRHIAARGSARAGDKLPAPRSGLSRLERMLLAQPAREPEAEEPPPPSTLADNPRFASVGALRIRATAGRAAQAARAHRSRQGEVRTELAEAEAAEWDEDSRRLQLAAQRQREAEAELEMAFIQRQATAEAIEREAQEAREKRLELHPIDVLRRVLQRDILEERAEIYDTLDQDWGCDWFQRLDRFVEAENAAAAEEAAFTRQAERVMLFGESPTASASTATAPFTPP
eukprot:TRINITY_DN4941_c1_g1_i1.p1 TRINITY_DN4941_c1_g1~~TRINITY_DN4941_c1_g1_i1.p1  ORF type:complete len:349 (+),score=134.46 TRINITY_DN4941_c1_g1_i1:68-1048(+)